MNGAHGSTTRAGAGTEVPSDGGVRGRQPGAERPAMDGGAVHRAARRSRNLALALTSLAMAFYFGFIAITIYRSHH